MKTKMKTYRQGDVLIEQVAELPKGLKRQNAQNGRIILALGEATGHHHSLADDAADWWKDGSDNQFVSLGKAASLEHQEHAAIELAPGHYRVRRQREYSPEEIRNVAD